MFHWLFNLIRIFLWNLFLILDDIFDFLPEQPSNSADSELAEEARAAKPIIDGVSDSLNRFTPEI